MNRYSGLLSENGIAIFLFHGVIPKKQHMVRNYTNKHIEEDVFRDVLNDLVNSGNPVSMDDIVLYYRNAKKMPARSFAITFDDGFENNYSIAAPILYKMHIPACFYITTDFIDNNTGSWIDEIESAFEKTGNFTIGSPDFLKGNYSSVNEKISLLEKIRAYIKQTPEDPYLFSQTIRKEIGSDDLTIDPFLDQKMNWDQIRNLNSESLFTIGGHGKTHRILDFLSDSDLNLEVNHSISRIKKELNQDVIHYSYPEGKNNCFSERVISLLKANGVVCSPSAESGINLYHDDLFYLKRIMVQ